ncbi:hypothetical protein KJ359_010473 [Pestalotiopsis sp. 9143b]|nr:hypothetical protein KJ359_010473 [Pestalotiopsis sp. 9143b]
MPGQFDAPGPASLDWERHRARIARLYALYKLSDVISTMRDEHQFTASHVAGVIRKDRHAFAELSTQYTGQVSPRRIQVYLHRLPEKRRQQIQMEATAYDGGLAGHFTLLLNMVTFTTTATEQYLYHIQEYMRGTSASGTWSKIWSPDASSYTTNFYLIDLALTAKNAFIHGYGNEAFRIINFAFNQLGSCMKSETVDILASIHWVGLIFYSFSREITASWFKHSVELSRIIYASSHYPQYQTAWIEQLDRMDIEQWTHVSVRAIDFNMRTLCKHLTTDGRPKSDFVRWTTMLMWRSRGMGQAIVPLGDFANVGRLTWEGFGCSDLEDPFTKLALAGVLFDEGRHSEAERIVDNILEMNILDTIEANNPEVRIREFALTENRHSFEALSYVWGPPTDVRPVVLEDGVLHVTVNCWSALQHLRHKYHTRKLWIDAICIDQRDTPGAIQERSRQIKLMGKVYQWARRVIVWLGPGNDTTWATSAMSQALTCSTIVDLVFGIETLRRANQMMGKMTFRGE